MQPSVGKGQGPVIGQCQAHLRNRPCVDAECLRTGAQTALPWHRRSAFHATTALRYTPAGQPPCWYSGPAGRHPVRSPVRTCVRRRCSTGAPLRLAHSRSPFPTSLVRTCWHSAKGASAPSKDCPASPPCTPDLSSAAIPTCLAAKVPDTGHTLPQPCTRQPELKQTFSYHHVNIRRKVSKKSASMQTNSQSTVRPGRLPLLDREKEGGTEASDFGLVPVKGKNGRQ